MRKKMQILDDLTELDGFRPRCGRLTTPALFVLFTRTLHRTAPSLHFAFNSGFGQSQGFVYILCTTTTRIYMTHRQRWSLQPPTASPHDSSTPLAHHTATPSSPSSVTLMRHTQRSSTPSRIDLLHTSAFWQSPYAGMLSACSNVPSGPWLLNTRRCPHPQEWIWR